MNIYKVERTDQWGYDDYDSFVCYAHNEEEARWMAPDPEYHMWKDGVYCYSYREQEPVNSKYTSWTLDPKTLKVTLCGFTDMPEGSKPDVILASYNAG